MQPPDSSVLLEQLRSLPAAQALLPRIGEQGGVYVVGGAVRDLLRGASPNELDLVVEGDVAQLAARLGGAVRRHERFGTCTVALDGFSYDIAQARRERYPRPGALPEVTPAGIEEDLRRRDFTVNAIAIELGGGRDRGGTHGCDGPLGPDGTHALRHAPGALEDLERGLLRVLHKRSFLDDPTRLLRLIRYHSRLHFDVEPETDRLAAAAIAGGALQTLSGPRVGAELRLLAREPDPVAALFALRDYGLGDAIEPGFGLADPAVLTRALALLPAQARADLLALAVAGRGVEQARLGSRLDELGFDGHERGVIAEASNHAQATADALALAKRPSEIAAAASGRSDELIALAGALGPAEQATEWLAQLRHVRLEISGDDLIAAGVSQGPAVGAGLHAALSAKLDGRLGGRQQELAEALSAARRRG